eukprot:gene47650-64611_t
MVSADLGDASMSLHVNARVAIALSQPRESRQQLADRASQALAKAYERKGTRFAVADSTAVPGAPDRSQLDAATRSALAQGQIAIVLQPQFDVASGDLVGAEALGRMFHPELGEVSAADLFASADRCDLREELSSHIQQEAIAIAAQWPKAFGHLRLAVNLGAEEMTDNYGTRLLQLLGS